MPKGKGKPAGGYHAGKKGTHGCKGYPTISADGTVHGCHPTKTQAAAQARAIWASVNSKKHIVLKDIEKATVAIGDFVIASCDDEICVGRVEQIIANGTWGLPGSEYFLQAEQDKAIIVFRCLEFESEGQYWEEEMDVCAVMSDEITRIQPLPLDAEALIVDGTFVPEPDTMPKVDKAWSGIFNAPIINRVQKGL